MVQTPTTLAQRCDDIVRRIDAALSDEGEHGETCHPLDCGCSVVAIGWDIIGTRYCLAHAPVAR